MDGSVDGAGKSLLVPRSNLIHCATTLSVEYQRVALGQILGGRGDGGGDGDGADLCRRWEGAKLKIMTSIGDWNCNPVRSLLVVSTPNMDLSEISLNWWQDKTADVVSLGPSRCATQQEVYHRSSATAHNVKTSGLPELPTNTPLPPSTSVRIL